MEQTKKSTYTPFLSEKERAEKEWQRTDYGRYYH